MKIYTKHQNIILYGLAILMMAGGLFLWVNQGQETQQQVQGTSATVADIKAAVLDLKADNAKNTIILCTIILSQDVELSKKDIKKVEAICEQKVQERAEGTAPSNQAGASSQSQGSSSNPSSSSNNKPKPNNSQPDNSQKPDNDGVVLDLPLLPRVHIPSPL